MTTNTEDKTPEQIAAENEAGFNAGFDKVAKTGAALEVSTETDKATEGKEPQAGAEEPAPEKKETAAEADPWEGVPKVVKDRLEELGKLPGQMRNIAGNIGGLKSQLDTALSTAKAAAEKKGAEAPSTQDVQAAMSDPEAWKKLKEDFPEWAGPVEAEINALRAELAKKGGGQVDVNAVTRQVTESLTPSLQAAERRAREFAQVDIKHEGWEETVNTKEFIGWLYEGGPTAEERAQLKSLEQSDPQKAAGYTADIAKRYPQWWSDKGAASFSDRGKDAIRLLDAFKSAKADMGKADEERARREKRLHGAVTPRGTVTSTGAGAISDEEAFNRGFKRAKGT